MDKKLRNLILLDLQDMFPAPVVVDEFETQLFIKVLFPVDEEVIQFHIEDMGMESKEEVMKFLHDHLSVSVEDAPARNSNWVGKVSDSYWDPGFEVMVIYLWASVKD